jgi:hypothetical protein
MAQMFRKQTQLRPTTMRTVAERRFDDAEALCNTRSNARANGAAYLAGFVIEILLKAQLVEKYPQTARKRQHEVHPAENEIWSLIWRSHDLETMLEQMPELEAALKKQAERGNIDYLGRLKAICATWTIQARYSPLTMLIGEAKILLESVRSLKELLK